MNVQISVATAAIVALLASASLAQDKPKPETRDASKPAASSSAKKYKDVGPDEFEKLRKTDTNAVVLDVRTKKEYEQGHIPGSVLIDFNSPDFAKEVAKLDKDKTYLVHCAAGGRSARACKKMEQMDFSKLYNLQGGMGAWEKAGKAVEK